MVAAGGSGRSSCCSRSRTQTSAAMPSASIDRTDSVIQAFLSTASLPHRREAATDPHKPPATEIYDVAIPGAADAVAAVRRECETIVELSSGTDQFVRDDLTKKSSRILGPQLEWCDDI
jgi:hypothetical protein